LTDIARRLAELLVLVCCTVCIMDYKTAVFLHRIVYHRASLREVIDPTVAEILQNRRHTEKLPFAINSALCTQEHPLIRNNGNIQHTASALADDAVCSAVPSVD